ncbi:MAG: VIT1/CCC1 transporter family protein [Bacteroidia bacterium]|nr:VIT1/CCC1 transporter family protein [Bacteroidia bacterium]
MSLKNIQTEIDASFLYKILADHEEDPNIASVFRQMSEIEHGHAIAFMKKNNLDASKLLPPSTKAKILNTIGKILGYDYILGVLLDTERNLSSSIISSRKRINAGSIGGNALRAAVLGGNDGLVSNFSLVMGIAGATSGKSVVLLTGLAGLLAGALSMALGEWISVHSSKELFENQMQLELEELENNPEGEELELALIYQSKGIPEEESKKMAKEIISNKDLAHDVLIKEELGINKEDLKGSAMEAAITSFLLFSIGAIIPVIPFFFIGGMQAVIFSTVLSGLGLFLIGASITLFTGKSVWYSGFRQVIFGLAAAAVTFGIGKLIGVSVLG